MAGLIVNDSPSMLQQKRRIFEGAAPHIYETYSGANSDSSSMIHFKAQNRYPIQELWAICTYTQDGSGDPSPTNIRTIHPQETITLTHAGLNLLQCDTFSSSNYDGFTCTGVRNAEGEIEYIDMAGTKTVQNVFRNLNYTPGVVKLPPTGAYVIGTYSDQANICYGGNSWAPPDRAGYSYNDNTATWKIYDITEQWAARNTGYTLVRIQIPPWNTETREIDTRIYPMVCQLQDRGCTYEPYKGKTYSIELPSPAYGASIDFISGNVVEHQVCETFTWGNNYITSKDLGSHTIRQFLLTYRTVADNTVYSVCNCAPYLYKYSSDTTHQYTAKSSNSDYAYIALPNDTPEDTQIQLVYMLETPQRSTLSQHQLFTFPGINNLWTAERIPLTIRYWDQNYTPERYRKDLIGLKVYKDNAYYIGRGALNAYNNNDHFMIIGPYDTGSSAAKSITFSTYPAKTVGDLSLSLRLTNESSNDIVDFWTIATSSATERTVTTEGRYIYYTLQKESMRDAFLYYTENGVNHYLFKGANLA